jgi:hypothetical protein
MNNQPDELQKLWQAESPAHGNIPAATAVPKRGEISGKAEVHRLRRSVRRDGWLKTGALVFLGAALPMFAGRLDAAAWGVIGFSLLAAALGAIQVVWANSWREGNAALPLSRGLAVDLELWRRRRLALAALLGATPALAWQVYQLAYLAMNPGSSARLANLLFLTAGGPLLWLLASWRQWARLEAWLLQISQALAAFDDEAAADYELARQRAARRTAIIAALLLILLLGGIVLFLMAR